MVAACSCGEPLASEIEPRLIEFAELVGSAVASAESRLALSRLAEAQAALRRVATLVARESRPDAVFAAVADEARGLIGAEITTMLHFEEPGSATLVAGSGAPYSELPKGSRVPTGPGTIGALVRASGRVERLERFDPDAGAFAAYLHRIGISSAVGAPIAVQGRPWGVLLAGASEPLPARTEARLAEFAELAAVAVANAESRAELAGSRARIVSAADEARRRIERDLHDGIQQRLVSLGLELRAAQFAIDDRPREAQRRIDAVAGGLTRTIDDLREISRGIHPASLAGGLASALKALARRSPVPVELDVGAVDPVAEPAQVAIYYVVSEALTNASKHAHASVVRVTASRTERADPRRGDRRRDRGRRPAARLRPDRPQRPRRRDRRDARDREPSGPGHRDRRGAACGLAQRDGNRLVEESYGRSPCATPGGRTSGPLQRSRVRGGVIDHRRRRLPPRLPRARASRMGASGVRPRASACPWR